MSANLTQDEISALMDAIQDGRVAAEAPTGRQTPVMPYDLTSRDRIIRGQMPTLEAINERIASSVATALSLRLRRTVRMTALPSTLLKFGDFGGPLTAPSTVAVLNLGGGHGYALAFLEGHVATALISAAMGDRATESHPQGGSSSEARRELTAIEDFVLRRLVTLLAEAMGAAWKPLFPFSPSVVRFEVDARLANIAPPSEPALLCPFELSEGMQGRLQIAIPFSAVESQKKALASAPKVSTGTDRRFVAALAHELEQVPVDVRVILGRTRSLLSRVMDLAEGDLVMLDTDEEGELQIELAGRAKLCGKPSVQGSSLAVVVTRDLCAAGAPNGNR